MVFRTYTEPVIIELGDIEYYEAAEAILQGQAVEHDAAAGRTVEPSDADGGLGFAGVALYDAAVGEMVAVASDGCVVRATSGSGTISAGDLVTTHGATGEEGEFDTAGTLGDYICGQALSDDEGDGGDVEVKLSTASGQVN